MSLVRFEKMSCGCRNGGLTRHAVFVGKYGHASRCEECRMTKLSQITVLG